MNLPPGVKEQCICGAAWESVLETEWGWKVKCESRHTLNVRAHQVAQKREPLAHLFVGETGETVRTGPQTDKLRPIPAMDIGLRLRLWWWRRKHDRETRRQIAQAFSAAGRTMRGPLDE